jgi:hypothetical protein
MSEKIGCPEIPEPYTQGCFAPKMVVKLLERGAENRPLGWQPDEQGGGRFSAVLPLQLKILRPIHTGISVYMVAFPRSGVIGRLNTTPRKIGNFFSQKREHEYA